MDLVQHLLLAEQLDSVLRVKVINIWLVDDANADGTVVAIEFARTGYDFVGPS